MSGLFGSDEPATDPNAAPPVRTKEQAERDAAQSGASSQATAAAESAAVAALVKRQRTGRASTDLVQNPLYKGTGAAGVLM